MSVKVTYDDTCELVGENNNKVTAEVLDFNPLKYITVTVNRQVKVTMQYIPRHNVYRGNMAGMELTTLGPKETITYEGRRKR